MTKTIRQIPMLIVAQEAVDANVVYDILITLQVPSDVIVTGDHLYTRSGWCPLERLGHLRWRGGELDMEEMYAGLELLECFEFNRTWTEAEWEEGDWDAWIEQVKVRGTSSTWEEGDWDDFIAAVEQPE